MNLNKTLKEKILQQFKSGASMEVISNWYDKKPAVVEQVIRKALIEADALLESKAKENGQQNAQELL